jgi:UDP-2,3-diacylglucosamine hydrolase
MTIQPNALFIADAHFNSLRKDLLPLLQKIETQKIQVSQLFLMGDIFDFLCGGIQHFYDTNLELITLIQSISKKIDTYYFEGNHDYNLETIFPHITIFARSQQPQYSFLDDKKTALAHGDIYTPQIYDSYSAIIRNKAFMKFLNFLNINNWLSAITIEKLSKKKICHPMENFEAFQQKRVEDYQCDLVIEGHFHQGYLGNKYINIPSFACEQKYMLYSDGEFKFIQV